MPTCPEVSSDAGKSRVSLGDPPSVGLVFDEDCQLHAPPERFNGKPALEHAERPERTRVMWEAVVKVIRVDYSSLFSYPHPRHRSVEPTGVRRGDVPRYLCILRRFDGDYDR